MSKTVLEKSKKKYQISYYFEIKVCISDKYYIKILRVEQKLQ